MKIIFATDYYYPQIGGIQVTTRRLSQRLSKMGNQVYIITPSKSFRNKTYKEGKVTIFGMRSIQVPFYKSLRYSPLFPSKRRVSEIFNEIKPDIVHIQSNIGIAYLTMAYAQKFGIATVATGHYMMEDFISNLKLPSFLWKSIEKISWFLFRSIWQKADIFTVPTRTAANYFARKSGVTREILTVSNGVDTSKFRWNKTGHNHTPTIAVIGRLDSAKRVDVIINSLPEILKKMRVKLLVIGSGTEKQRLEDIAKDLGVERYVNFMGFLPEKRIVDIYRRVDLLVTASVIETQGIALLEALSSGLPVVAADAGATPELVKNGKNGYLFRPGDSKSLAKKVLKILPDKTLKERMGKESIKIAKEHDIQEVVVRMQGLYEKGVLINSTRRATLQPTPFYLSKGFSIKLALVVLLLGILFRNLLVSPSVANAKSLALKNKIMNSKLVMKIETLDAKLKTSTLHKVIIK